MNHIMLDELDICQKFLAVWSRIKNNIEQFATDNNLTMQQIFVLYHLCNQDQILMGTLAKTLHCDASNVTGMVDRLQSGGFITRTEMPTDRRARQLKITPKGRALIDKLIPRLADDVGFEQLSTAEATALHSFFDKILT